MRPILSVELRLEHDMVLVRQRARQIASLLEFNRQDEVRIATAVSEIARNAYEYARHGKVEFGVEEGQHPAFIIRVSDRGGGIDDLPGILDGHYKSPTGMGMGIVGAKRLMDDFQIHSAAAEGTVVVMRKYLRSSAIVQDIARISDQLASQEARNPLEEMQRQNQELLATLEELEGRSKELVQLNRELEETNRGVLALYAELDEKAQSLRQASDLKSRFLSNVTHEFRTPLNSVLSLSGMLLDRVDGPLSQEQERQVSYIRKAAQDLSELVNDLLDLAKVEAGKVSLHPSRFEVAELFRALRGMLRPLLANNEQVDLLIEDPREELSMYTDESKVSQILRNLISNALKYTEGGQVRVFAEINSDRTVTFSVRDTGIGIAREDRERIFEEFDQVAGAHQNKVKGTGLGLPLARKLATLLGGHISLRSELGFGSTFAVTLPITYREHVLIVDEDEVSRDTLKGLFAATCYSVIETDRGKKALDIVRQLGPVCVLLDVTAPDINGPELLDQLKADRSTRGIPVIAMTSQSLTEEEKARLSTRTVAILSKAHFSREGSAASLYEALLSAGLEPPRTGTPQ